MTISLTGQIAEVERELALRRNVYARDVASGKMKQTLADLLIERMDAVRRTLMWLQKHEADIRVFVETRKTGGNKDVAA